MAHNGDPRSFMYYKDTYYINGTEITLKEEYIKSQMRKGEKLWKYAKYDRQVNRNGQICYFFCIAKTDWSFVRSLGMHPAEINNYEHCFTIPALQLENAIDEITKPIKLSQEQHDAILKGIEKMITKKDWEYPELVVLWIVYILVLIGSTVFNEFYIIWLIASVIFNKMRKDIRKW